MSQGVIPFTYWAFKLIQHQIDHLCKPYEREFYIMYVYQREFLVFETFFGWNGTFFSTVRVLAIMLAGAENTCVLDFCHCSSLVLILVQADVAAVPDCKKQKANCIVCKH